jgi:hypothetical protein
MIANFFQSLEQNRVNVSRQLAAGEVAEAVEHRIGNRLQARISDLQALDRKHWRDIIRRLKELRGKGELMPEGERVSTLD